jgi:serine/threonine protein kinase/tetratricopeptide (TPR) repeat protein
MASSESSLIAAARRQIEELGPPGKSRFDRGSASSDPGRSAGAFGRPGGAADGGPAGGDQRAAGLDDYRLVRELQRGGQGVVYEAVQAGTQRRVAIKVIRDGPLAGSNERLRFDREVQILGALQHPNIVTILESGRSGGCEFFVMQFVDGPDLEAYVEPLRASARGRAGGRDFVRAVAELMAKICEAVHAAHLAGVVHRDLKPTNVRIDAEGRPHILDFGLAKRLPAAGRTAGGEEVTLTGEFVGTLPYASPEQAGGAAHVDTRTDVYSLGVMIYRLLTRRFPYDVTGPITDVLDRIRNAPPVRPRELNPDIAVDLETIVLRCLQKAPERRYETAGDVGRDLRRWLAGEAIDARRDSAVYLLRKYVQRHSAAFGAGAAMAVVIVAALVTSLWFWRDAARERDRAVEAQIRERQRAAELATALAAESAARNAAIRSASESNAMRSFVLSMLESADPEENQGRELSVREMLDKGAERLLARHMQSQPALRGALLLTLSDAYQSLGELDKAEHYANESVALRLAALGPDAEATLRSELNRVEIMVARGRYGPAQAAMDQLAGAFESADASLRASFEMQRGIVLRELGRLAESEAALEAAIGGFEASGADDHVIAVALNAIGVLYLRQERYAEADEKFEAALARMRAAGLQARRDVGTILNNQASCRYYMGQYESADPLFLQAYDHLRAMHGEDHPLTVTVANNRGALLRRLRRLDEAERFGLEVVARRRSLLGSLHPEVAASLVNLAAVYADLDRYAEAERLLREAYEIRLDCLPEGHPAVAEAERLLGTCLLRQGRFAEAEAELTRAYERMSANADIPPARRMRFIEALIDLYESSGRFDLAKAWRARAGGRERGASVD